ncbi:MAG: hypothetical protein J7621_03445 [Niastella sp.]|nr:hypothetical protein [Niastella sp.]
MRKLNTTLLLLVFLSFIPDLVSAQSITVKQSEEAPDYEYEVFRPAPGSFIAINYGSTHGAFSYKRNYSKPTITGYDKNMKEVYTRRFEELEGNRYLGAIEFDKKLHIFCADDEKIFSLPFDAVKAQAAGKLTEVLTATNEPESFYKGFSPDSNYCFAAFACPHPRKSYQQFEGVIMDKNMKVITKFSFQLEKIKSYIDNTTFVLSPEGTLYVVNQIRVKPEKNDFRPFQYLLTEVNKEGKTVTTALNDLPTGRLSNIVWTNSKSGLAFTGLLSKTEKEAFQYLVAGEFSSWSKKITGLKELALANAPFWGQASGEFLLLMKTRGISANVKMVKYFILPDGAKIMVLQPLESSTYFTSSNRAYTTTHAGSVYILKIKKELELEWMQAIPLGQHEASYQIYCGVLPVLQNNKDLYIFFHDYIQNTGAQPAEAKEMGLGSSWPSIQLTSFHVNDKGALNRIKIASYTPDEHRFAPGWPNISAEGEAVITLYHHRNLGKSTYKLGLLNIKQ